MAAKIGASKENKAINTSNLSSKSEEPSTLYQLFIRIEIIQKMRLNSLSQPRSTLASFSLDKGIDNMI